ncbi:MAG: glycine cleavage system protein GcvH [Verrucomicrobiaceae bacterium]|nr:glycine cleavage system protein GcvH [Verrucomicrobiaceae bacterium]
MNIPENLKYTASHEWVSIKDGVATIGITDHAQEELSELVYIELPEQGRQVSKGDPVAVIESVKAASDIYAPLSGEIVEPNLELADDPSRVNKDPHGEGWMLRINITDESEVDTLLDAATYKGGIS